MAASMDVGNVSVAINSEANVNATLMTPLHNGSKISKTERKTRKKILRSQHTVLKHDGIEVSDQTTKILCVNNAGLDVGASYDDVYACFSCRGDIDDIIMLPKKPYSFVCYHREEDAEKALESLNGTKMQRILQADTCLTMYIFYVSQVPSELSPSADIPPGLILLRDFVTGEYSQQLLQAINWGEPVSQEQQRELKHRQVKHYGYEFKYGINDVDVNDPLSEGIPKVCSDLLDKALKTGHVQHWPDQLTINRYLPSQGIPPHVDTPCAFEDGIMSLSLGSQVLMDFRHPDGRHLTVVLPPNSLLIMTGESRYVWSHGITPRKSDIIPAPDGKLNLVQRGTRTSFTFRRIIHPKERERRRLLAENESSENKPAVPLSMSDAVILEKQHVHEVYEEIADHFSGTRHTPWPKIVDFLNQQLPGSLLADIGCGNGKYLGVNKSLYEIGSDRSTNLVDICRGKQCEVFVGDILSIPLRSESVDVCLCIAVIHHLSTEERRLQALEELIRILCVGGKALIYVWAMEQELNKVKSKYLKEKTFENDKRETKNEPKSACQNQQLSCDSLQSCDQEKQHGQSDSTSNKKYFETGNSSELKRNNIESSIRTKSEKELNESVKDKSEQTSKQNMPALAIHKNRTQFQQQDLLVPWQLKQKKTDTDKSQSDTVFHRYYHVFEKGEMEQMCERVSNCKVVGGYYDQGNWAVILEKVQL